MKKFLASLIVGASLFIPGVAQAHTGSVSCTDQGVVFSYNANFANDAVVTETVNGVEHQYTVKAQTASTDTIETDRAYTVAKASWTDGEAKGYIRLTELNCPNPVVHPDVCVPTETVTKTIYTPGPATIQYIDVPGLTTYITKIKYKTHVKYRVRWKTVYKFITVHPEPKPKKPRDGGVAG